jgi:hypothetical protein
MDAAEAISIRVLVIAVLIEASNASADVIVLTNRTNGTISSDIAAEGRSFSGEAAAKCRHLDGGRIDFTASGEP